ncbi:hypothetical protein lacNasYZ03_07320 [Lactobacillus nasalidis]|uniref:GGDEF domain-containing protein n=1 Tax=Lactobacillus nasalidis TaxID=2797258 RepID=A0ABQ3W6M5_9LACO|nr:hypothetical protein lacNasYZ03_07320 [Lactobacillus nasalidis]
MLASSTLVISIIIKKEWDSINQRHQDQIQLNSRLAAGYFEKKLEIGQFVTESIESEAISTGGDTNLFVKNAGHMLEKYSDIYSLLVLRGKQAVTVYRQGKIRRGRSEFADNALAQKALEYCGRKHVNGIIGPLSTSGAGQCLLVCRPIYIKGKLYAYALAVIKQKYLFARTFKELTKLGYRYRFSKTRIAGKKYNQLVSTLGKRPAQASMTFKLGECNWKLETARKDAGQIPRDIKASIFLGTVTVIINTLLSTLLVSYVERGKILVKLVNTDYLTGLMSRQAFDRNVSRYLDQHLGEPAAGAIIDVDDFKYINDLYGHEAGDEALRNLAGSLLRIFGKQGLVCRNGGDEFAVFLKKTDPPAARAAFEKLFDQSLAFSYQGRSHPYTVSLGFAVYPDQGQSREVLMNKADVALYDVKSAGKAAMAVYSPSMSKEGRAQLGFNLRDLAVNLPGAFFIYRHDDGKILFANKELLRIMECASEEEFIEYVGRKVKGLIAPEDYDQAVASCNEQVGDGDEGLAQLDYHVITKETRKRIYMHAVAHMVKNPYFGEIYYVIIGPRPDQNK